MMLKNLNELDAEKPETACEDHDQGRRINVSSQNGHSIENVLPLDRSESFTMQPSFNFIKNENFKKP